MSGFRCFHLDWIVSSSSTSGSVTENGRVTNLDGTYGYTDDVNGVKSCLEDFCQPLVELENNHEGWQVDLTLCPIKQAVLLPPNTDVYVMFFKHTSGARLMIGLNYWGMLSCSESMKPHNYCSIGFRNERTYMYWTPQPTGYGTMAALGGIFASMIPPANNGDIQDVFTLNYSVQEEQFYCKTMTPVFAMRAGGHAYNGNANVPPVVIGTSFIHQGTTYDNNTSSVSTSNINSYGVLLGQKVTLSLLVKDEAIGFFGIYKESIYMGGFFIGRLLSNVRNPDDVLSTRDYAILTSETGYYSKGYYLWNPAQMTTQSSLACNVTGTYWSQIKPYFGNYGFLSSSSIFEYFYCGYVCGNLSTYPMSVNGQTKARLRSDLFRFSNQAKKQHSSFNNSTWYTCPYIVCSNNNTYNSDSNFESIKNMLISWNGEANGNRGLF